MRYTLRHGYEEPHRIAGEYLDGDFKGAAGEWFMEETASGETTVTFKVGIDPGSWVPGHIARTLNQQILRESVERLKTEVEAAHTGEPNRGATRRRREISRIPCQHGRTAPPACAQRPRPRGDLRHLGAQRPRGPQVHH